MKCLLCNVNFLTEYVLRNHHIRQHLINENDVYLNDLCQPDSAHNSCEICQIEFENVRGKKKNKTHSSFSLWTDVR